MNPNHIDEALPIRAQLAEEPPSFLFRVPLDVSQPLAAHDARLSPRMREAMVVLMRRSVWEALWADKVRRGECTKALGRRPRTSIPSTSTEKALGKRGYITYRRGKGFGWGSFVLNVKGLQWLHLHGGAPDVGVSVGWVEVVHGELLVWEERRAVMRNVCSKLAHFHAHPDNWGAFFDILIEGMAGKWSHKRALWAEVHAARPRSPVDSTPSTHTESGDPQ